MIIPEAKQLLSEVLATEGVKPYSELKELVALEHVETFEIVGRSGTKYQVEIQYFWDDRPEGTIRIMASIDDGGLRAFVPITDSELVSPPNPAFNPDPRKRGPVNFIR